MPCTSAVLTGIALDCGNVGGIKKLYVANVADVSTIAFDASGEVSAITMAAGKTFKSFNFRKGNASFTVNGNKDDKNGTYFATTEISAQFNKMEKATRTEIVELVKANAYVIIKDNNGTYWFVGRDSYVTISTAAGQSGATMGDGNFYNIVLMSETAEVPGTVASGLITTSVVDSLV
jgi:hypothetical protein